MQPRKELFVEMWRTDVSHFHHGALNMQLVTQALSYSAGTLGCADAAVWGGQGESPGALEAIGSSVAPATAGSAQRHWGEACRGEGQSRQGSWGSRQVDGGLPRSACREGWRVSKSVTGCS